MDAPLAACRGYDNQGFWRRLGLERNRNFPGGFIAMPATSTASRFTGLGVPSRVIFSPEPGAIPLASGGAATPVFVDANDWPGVIRAARDFQADVERVTGVRPAFSHQLPSRCPAAVIVGTLGRSALVDELARSGKIDGDWRPLGSMGHRNGRRAFPRHRPGPGHRGQRQARRYLWNIRPLRADRRFSLVLVGGRSSDASRRCLRSSGKGRTRFAGRKIQRHFP